jgi:hypothetical protein
MSGCELSVGILRYVLGAEPCPFESPVERSSGELDAGSGSVVGKDGGAMVGSDDGTGVPGS